MKKGEGGQNQKIWTITINKQKESRFYKVYSIHFRRYFSLFYLVGAAEGVCAREGDNLLIIETHAVEDFLQVLSRCLGSITERGGLGASDVSTGEVTLFWAVLGAGSILSACFQGISG